MYTVYIILGIIGAIPVPIILGFCTKKINESKGYYGGFAWGFWLGVIGLIVVACKPNRVINNSIESSPLFNGTNSYYEQNSNYSALNNPTLNLYERSFSNDGSWVCYRCRKINSDYVGTCSCGISKDENINNLRNARTGDAQTSMPKMNTGEWICNRCKKINPSFIGFCKCGMSRGESKNLDEKKKAEVFTNQKKEERIINNQQKDNGVIYSEDKCIEILKKYKELLDMGALTQEEFDKKKRDILFKTMNNKNI